MNMYGLVGIGLVMLAATYWLMGRKARQSAMLVLAALIVLLSIGQPGLAAAASVSKTFTTHSVASNPLSVYGGETFTYAFSGTWVGQLELQRSRNGSAWESFLVVSSSFSTNPALTGVVSNTNARGVRQFYRVYMSTHSSGSAVTTIADANDLVEERVNLKGAPVMQFYDDGVTIPGTLGVTGTLTPAGAVAAGGAITTTSGGVSASSGTSSGATAFKIKGAYTSTQISTLLALPGEVVFNVTTGNVCPSTGTGAGLTGAWVNPSTTTTPTVRAPCY